MIKYNIKLSKGQINRNNFFLKKWRDKKRASINMCVQEITSFKFLGILVAANLEDIKLGNPW